MFPLSKVQRLSDYGGSFALSVRCVACKHERVIPARSLAHRVGRDARVVEVVRRLRCSMCNRREVEVMVVGIPR